jgi:Leucine-rich repeat (LRR) protein
MYWDINDYYEWQHRNAPINIDVIELDISSSELRYINVNPLVNLRVLKCNNNLLTELYVKLDILETLDCSDNNIKNLSIYCNKLKYINCSNNKLLNLNNVCSAKLITLDCYGNKLSMISKRLIPRVNCINCYGNNKTIIIKDMNECNNTCTTVQHLTNIMCPELKYIPKPDIDTSYYDMDFL